MTYELARSLLLSETLTPALLGEALLTATRERVSLARALLNVRAIDATRLDKELARNETPSLQQVLPVAELMARLPPGLCARLMAFPVRLDPRTGTVDVAAADTHDPHAPEEIGFHLDAPVRIVRASLWAIEAALVRSSRPPPPMATIPVRSMPPPGMPSRPPPNREAWDAPSIFSDPPPAPRVPEMEMAIPLTRRTLNQIRAIEAQHPLSLEGIEYQRQPADHLTQAMENAAEYAAEQAAEHTEERRMVTLMPPSFVPPPPNTERNLSYPVLDSAPRTAPMPQMPPIPPLPPMRRSSPPNAPFVEITGLLAVIRAARTRDELLDLVLLGTRKVARRVAIFAVKRQEFVGWTCSPEFARIEDLRALSISLNAPSVLMLGAVSGGYLGPIENNEVHAPLLRLMGSATRDVAVAALKVLGRPAALILADDLKDTMLATRRLDELSRAAGDQLAIIVRDRR